MRGFITVILICLFLISQPAEAFLFHKKDYKKIFLTNALNAEQRHDDKSAFHSYEKAIYYYKKDKNVIEAYAGFCERQKYYQKAEELYKKLYILTKDDKYLFKANICQIKNGKISDKDLEKIIANKELTSIQKKELNKSLINHYAYKGDWQKVKETCNKIPDKDIDKNLITTCIVANEKTKDEKNAFKYYLRHNQLYPQDTTIINKVISLAEKFNNATIQEQFIKKLSAMNPLDNGIKYKLAGFYEKQQNWQKAAKVYEAIMRAGDKSNHVMTSYAYVISQINPQKSKGIYATKPLTEFQIEEKKFYHAWRIKDYNNAQKYLTKMLKEQPNNKKLLKHKVDIDISQNNYPEAILIFEKIKSASLQDSIFLAFLYSKINDYSKSLDIIEKSLINHPRNKELLNLGLDYSLANKNWDKAIFYTDNLLKYEPKSKKLLKMGGDLYSIEKNFDKAIPYYQTLVKYYPETEYKMSLANLYMANKNFDKAQEILELLYNKNPENFDILQAYLNTLLAQQKTYDAYALVRKHNLLDTKEGYAILGDLNMKNKMYNIAASYFYKAAILDSKDMAIKNNLAFCYRMMGYKTGAANLYNDVLREEPENKDAILGLGSLEIDKKNFETARKIFKSLIEKNPEYRAAKVAMAHSYIANNEKLSALEELDKLPEDEETKMMKAQIYYDFSMPVNSKQELKSMNTKDSKTLKAKIKKDNAFTITPVYAFFNQQLASEFDLDYQKYGIKMAQDTINNSNVFMEYNVYWYKSGSTPVNLYNVTNEFRGGIQSRPTKKIEYKADLGVKSFQFGGGMILTDSWIKYHFSDKFNLKLGFSRNNLEQSYLSAVGEDVNGIFTGRVADNRLYLEYNALLPKQFYSFGRIAYGILPAQNLITNQYGEGMLGIGKIIYNNPKNKWIQTTNLDLVTYNSFYQYNLLNIYNNAGQLFGGYFSPSYFNATTVNIKAEGKIKKWHLKYGISAFAGPQTSITPDFVKLSWGVGPYIAYELNDHITFNAAYNYYNYADVQRNYFTVNAVIKGFKKYDKK